MKNDLFEKNSGQFIDEKRSTSLKKSPSQNSNQIEDEPGFFRTFFKYVLIIGSCIMIPLFITNNNFTPDWLTDVRNVFVTKSDTKPASFPTISVPPVPPVPSFPENSKLGDQISKKVNDALEKAGIATQLSEEAQLKLDEALSNNPGLVTIDDEKISKAVEEALAKIDKKDLGATIEASIAAALNSLKSLETLNYSSNGFSSTSKSKKLSSSYIDYLAEMKKLGFTETFENYELKSFYDNGILANVLQDWKKNNWLDKFEFYELVSLYNNKITPSQLKPWIDAGYTDTYEAHEIISFINNTVTFDYLKLFADADLLNKYEFWEIVSFKNNNITPEKLKPWLDSNYADRFESHELISLITNKVPPSFLDELDNKGLLGGLEFWEITNLFKEK